jgi:DNA-binding NtrC family response regulator
MKKFLFVCVDDEVIILRSIREQLKRHFPSAEFIIEVAEGAEEALEIIDEYQQEGQALTLVISDWLMPGIKGDEFLCHVHSKNPEAVTLLLTGQADESAVARAREQANLFDCIAKPWDERKLLSTVALALSSYNEAQSQSLPQNE